MHKWILSLFIVSVSIVSGRTVHIGEGMAYNNLSPAAQQAVPGDTLLFHAGVYAGQQSVGNLQGDEDAWIVIIAESPRQVFIRGGSNAWHFQNAAFVKISGFVFEQQTANGINVDDGGDYATPTHHIVFEDCLFRDMNATGNNDLLKMSGVDQFSIRDCEFLNGAAGGSGIDMVGCHDGEIVACRFENMGSNAIQAKGGSQNVRIQQSWFENCGQRSVNLGGSTGLPYFRPTDAPYEAADLQVYANVFIGSIAPVAYVGCVRTKVINNTIINPEKWVVRILQENVDPERFLECGDNSFENNLIYQSTLSTETNVGGNTRPETFSFSANFWFNYENSNWRGPNVPVSDSHQVINKDPLFIDVIEQNFKLSAESPAIGLVEYTDEPLNDFDGVAFGTPRSVGAFEGNPSTGLLDFSETNDSYCYVAPNPFNDVSQFNFMVDFAAETRLRIYDIRGRLVGELVEWLDQGEQQLAFEFPNIASGVYLYEIDNGSNLYLGKLTVLR